MKKLALVIGLLGIAILIPVILSEPAQNAIVSVEWTDGKHSYSNSTFTDVNGYYEMKVAEGNTNITAFLNKMEGNKWVVVSNSTGEFFVDGIEWKNITLPEFPADTVTIRGHVYDNKTGLKISNANISIQFHDDYFSGGNFTFSDLNGYYEIHAPASNITIVATASGYYYDMKSLGVVGEGEIRTVDLYLEPLVGILKGYVRDEGNNPVENVVVSISNKSYYNYTYTDVNGYYEFRVIEANYVLIASTINYLNPMPAQIYVGEGETKWMNITLNSMPSDNAWVDGFVKDENGLPIENANVTVIGTFMDMTLNASGTYIRHSITDATGYYNISVPGGTAGFPPQKYSQISLLSAEKDGYFSNSTILSGFTAVIVAGETKHVNVILESMPPENCMVRGYVYIKVAPPAKKILYVGGIGAGNYTSIQDAIKNASDGDIIKVYPGTYDGPIIIDKEIKLIGDPTIDGHGGYGIKIEANNVSIENFTIFNCSTGIYVHNSSFTLRNVTIRNCTVYNCTTYGIYLKYANENYVIGCTIKNITDTNENAIYLEYANDNRVENNEIFMKDTFKGIEIYSSNRNIVRNNTITGEGNNYYGISIWIDSDNNKILNNSITGNIRNGIVFGYSNNNEIRNNFIYISGDGVEFQTGECKNNTVENNEINAKYGIYFNIFLGMIPNEENKILNNVIKAENGFYIRGCRNGTFINNSIDATNYAIYIENSTNNAFINNTIGVTKFSFTYKGNISIKNASLPALPPSHWHDIGKFLEIGKLDDEPAWVDIRIYYNDEDVAGLLEDTLKIWKYNGTWIEEGWNGSRYLDIVANVVGVNITSFSIFAPLAMSPNHLPYATNPSPANGSTDVSLNPTLSVVVYDADSDTMNVTFYDASDDSVIGSAAGILSGGVASIVWHDLSQDTTYYWYVIVNDSFAENKSQIWHFTTTIPKPSIVYVNDDWAGLPDGTIVDGHEIGYDAFANIQDGIDAVEEGGTVYVYEGIYNESIIVNKEVSIISLGIPANTIIKATQQDAVTLSTKCIIDGFTIRDAFSINNNVRGIWIKADGCIIRNVTITNITAAYNDSISIYAYGIMIHRSNNCSLKNVTIYDIKGEDYIAYGIYVGPYSNNTFFENVSIFNITASHFAYGIRFDDSKQNKILHTEVKGLEGNFGEYGIYMSQSNMSLISSSICDASYSIFLYKSSNNSIYSSSLFNCSIAIYISSYSSNNIIFNCSIYNNSYYGVEMVDGEHNTLYSNDIYNNSKGIYLNDVWNNNISSNNIYNNHEQGILLSFSGGNTIYSNHIYNNAWDGISISTYSSSNAVLSNYIYNNSYDGIKLYYYTSNNIIKYNYIYNNSNGIRINYMNHTGNVIEHNHIYRNRNNGIFSDAYTTNTIIADNEIYENEVIGIYIINGEFNNIVDCNIYSNKYYGIRLENSINNTINACTIYSNGDDGILIYSNSMNNSISNCNIYSNDDFGIWISTSSNYNNISTCNIYSNANDGIGIGFSSIHNRIYGCNIHDNTDGIYLAASNNVISTCNISSNAYIGVKVWQASNNTIYSNHITGNYYGIHLSSSSNNLIYNNYFNNTINAWDDGNNIWNISKTSGMNIVGGAWLGGNFWHDYAGNDINGDGLGDTLLPYNASGNIVNGGDMLPLIIPTNHPPATPYNPSPANGATDVALVVTLTWQCYDVDNDSLTYDVYFGLSPATLEKKAGNITINSYDVGKLQPSTTYYWRVVAWDEHEAKTTSPIWNFTTKENTPPTVTNPHPANGSTGRAINPTLAVDVDDADGDLLTVTFYDASDDSIIGMKENVQPGTTVSITWENLQYSTQYSWYVVVSDGIDETKSPTWYFTTKEKPQYTLTITISPTNAGTVTLNPAGGIYDEGVVVTLQAIANAGYEFSHWGGDATGTNPTIQITMNSNKSIIAYFEAVTPNTPPNIEIISPSNGSTVSGIVTIHGKAWDIDGNQTLQRVEIRIDGGGWIVAEGTTSWNYEWDTTQVENGLHTIEARAYDGMAYSNIVSITLNVQNVVSHKPSISITEPANGSIVKGSIIVKGKAWDVDGNDTLQRVEIRIDGGEWQNATGTINWAYTLDTTKLSNGLHTIEARAYDGIDYSNITSITLNVQNEKIEKRIPWLVIGIIALIVIIVVAVAVLYLIKR